MADDTKSPEGKNNGVKQPTVKEMIIKAIVKALAQEKKPDVKNYPSGGIRG